MRVDENVLSIGLVEDHTSPIDGLFFLYHFFRSIVDS